MGDKKYHIITYGCQMNVHESEKLAGILESMQYGRAERQEDADIILFNTCCIRENAEHRAYGNIGALKAWKRQRPDRILCVVGCMTQQEGAAERLRSKFPFVDIILGTHNLHTLGDKLSARLNENRFQTEILQEGGIDEGVPVVRSGGVSAWVNIMYGCDNFCTYCIVPYVRGRERSRSRDNILSEVQSLLSEGFREITLLGQNVNSYGHDAADGATFSRLIGELAELPYRYRLRFMTSHPKDLTEDVIEAIATHPNLCKSIHLPVQAGSDRILRAMNRKYDSARYCALVRMIRERIPGVQLTSDIMVGFPGESEADFLQTLKLVEEVRFSSAFTFVYSRRAGTVADSLPDQVPEEVKKDRIMRLVKVQNRISRERGEEYVGNVYEVLIEGRDAENPRYLVGRTDCGRLVSFEGEPALIGQFRDVSITRGGISSLKGILS